MATPNNDIRALIDAATDARSAGTAGVRQTPANTSPKAEMPSDLRSAMRQAQANSDSPQSAAATPSAFKSPWVMAGVAALALLLLGAGVWKTAQPSLTGHPDTLQQLAQSVEQYRHSRNGSLPEQLSNLEHFPKNAVEWQTKHWQARDAAGRTEIMFAPNGTRHYRIVLRKGSEVWVYNDIDGQVKQTHQ
jgi:hypothetical protein